MSGSKEAPDSHAYGDVDGSAEADKLVQLMEYMGNHPSSAKLYVTTRGPIQNGHRVLDIGCGTAFDVDKIAMLVGTTGRVDCMDLSQAMIDYATRTRGKHPQATFRVGDIRQVPFGTSEFDVVRCVRVMHHLTPEDQRRAVAEMRRVLKPGGKVVIAEPAWERYTFFGQDNGAGMEIRDEIMADFIGNRAGSNLLGLLEHAGFRAIVSHPVVREVKDLADFDRFYGLSAALLSARKRKVRGVDTWEAIVRKAASEGRFYARLPIPVVIATKA